MPGPSVSFEGIQSVGTIIPPDTNGDVGPNHYVQTVNVETAVYGKTGALLLGPFPTNALFSGFGGACQTTNDGDPIVLYDPLADRWIISQFALPNFPNGPFSQCIAVSQGSDPTGAYHRYEFVMPFNALNDYPKFGVWPDGYYMSANLFAAGTLDFNGVAVFAFQRSAMLTGAPASGLFSTLGTTHFSLLPSDLDGLTPPPSGAPNPFMELDILGNSEIHVWEFHADFANPANSTFTPQPDLPVAPFDGNLCNFSTDCIPQPGTAEGLDAIGGTLMFRLAYRNLPSHQAIVANATVDVGGDHAGIRWFELRNSGGAWSVFQQGTHAPDADNRWMGSIAMDRTGNIALGFSESSAATFPSIGWAGRLTTDPLGTLGQGEATVIAGAGSQTDPAGRWGDYSMMSVDPTDDCTFWYTQEYYPASSARGWHTRIAAFSFPECQTGPEPATASGELKKFYDTQGKYKLYRVGKNVVFRGEVDPNHGGDPLTFIWEQHRNGAWRNVSTDTFDMKPNGSVTVFIDGDDLVKLRRYRIRCSFAGDADHAGNDSPWSYFKAKG